MVTSEQLGMVKSEKVVPSSMIWMEPNFPICAPDPELATVCPTLEWSSMFDLCDVPGIVFPFVKACFGKPFLSLRCLERALACLALRAA